MSHRIIITNSALIPPPQNAVAEAPESIVYEITYTPDHGLTPAQEGAKVAQIKRLLDRMQESPGGSGDT